MSLVETDALSSHSSLSQFSLSSLSLSSGPEDGFQNIDGDSSSQRSGSSSQDTNSSCFSLWEGLWAPVELFIPEPWLSRLVSGEKKSEARWSTVTLTTSTGVGARMTLTTGPDRATKVASVSATVLSIKRYPSLRAYIIQEGLKSTFPGMQNFESAVLEFERRWPPPPPAIKPPDRAGFSRCGNDVLSLTFKFGKVRFHPD